MEEAIDFDEPERKVRKPLRALLFHIATLLDVNECVLDLLRWTNEGKEIFVVILEKHIVREHIELDSDLVKH